MNELIATVGGMVFIGYFFATLIVSYKDGVEIPNTSEFI